MCRDVRFIMKMWLMLLLLLPIAHAYGQTIHVQPRIMYAGDNTEANRLKRSKGRVIKCIQAGNPADPDPAWHDNQLCILISPEMWGSKVGFYENRNEDLVKKYYTLPAQRRKGAQEQHWLTRWKDNRFLSGLEWRTNGQNKSKDCIAVWPNRKTWENIFLCVDWQSDVSFIHGYCADQSCRHGQLNISDKRAKDKQSAPPLIAVGRDVGTVQRRYIEWENKRYMELNQTILDVLRNLRGEVLAQTATKELEKRLEEIQKSVDNLQSRITILENSADDD